MKSYPFLILPIFVACGVNFASAIAAVPSSPEVVNLKYINDPSSVWKWKLSPLDDSTFKQRSSVHQALQITEDGGALVASELGNADDRAVVNSQMGNPIGVPTFLNVHTGAVVRLSNGGSASISPDGKYVMIKSWEARRSSEWSCRYGSSKVFSNLTTLTHVMDGVTGEIIHHVERKWFTEPECIDLEEKSKANIFTSDSSGLVFVFHGYQSGNTFIYRYDLRLKTWTQTANLGQIGFTANVFAEADKVFVIGSKKSGKVAVLDRQSLKKIGEYNYDGNRVRGTSAKPDESVRLVFKGTDSTGNVVVVIDETPGFNIAVVDRSGKVTQRHADRVPSRIEGDSLVTLLDENTQLSSSEVVAGPAQNSEEYRSIVTGEIQKVMSFPSFVETSKALAPLNAVAYPSIRLSQSLKYAYTTAGYVDSDRRQLIVWPVQNVKAAVKVDLGSRLAKTFPPRTNEIYAFEANDEVVVVAGTYGKVIKINKQLLK